jgi:hypothetical protein
MQDPSLHDDTTRPLLAEIRRRTSEGVAAPEEVPTGPLVYLSPEDEGRRFPLLTRAQLTMIAAGGILLLLTLIVGFLLWRQQRRDTSRAAQLGSIAQPAAVPAGSPAAPGASPSPTPVPDDNSILAGVKAAVTNYNPTGFSNYTLEVKEGIVTITGNADTMPEKEGVENVVRPVSGVKAIVNNLVVRLTPVMVPAGLTVAEVKRMEDALRKGQDTDRQSRDDADRRREQLEAQNEIDKRRRDAAAIRVREEEDRLRREAEDKMQREAAEYERKLEEQRRLEAERRARAEQARPRSECAQIRDDRLEWDCRWRCRSHHFGRKRVTSQPQR